jgi:hypothetical protein
MKTSRVERLGKIGIGFDEGPLHKDNRETGRLCSECAWMFLRAWDRIDRVADLLDEVNDLDVVPRELKLTEGFSKAYSEIVLQVEAEWLQDSPDMKRFKELVETWRQVCMTELRFQMKALRPPVV